MHLQASMKCTINSKIIDTAKGVYLSILNLHSILAVAILIAHDNCMVMLIWASKFVTTKMECNFEMGQ